MQATNGVVRAQSTRLYLYYKKELLSVEPMAIEAACQQAGWQISGRGQKNEVRRLPPPSDMWYARSTAAVIYDWNNCCQWRYEPDQMRCTCIYGSLTSLSSSMHRQPQPCCGWDPILYVLLFPYGTDGFHLDISRTARQSRSPLWNTAAAGDWCNATAGPERRAVWPQAVPAVRSRLLCENGTAAAKLSAV